MDKMISVSEAADILGVTRSAVLKKIYTGRLSAKKVGRSYVISRDELPIVLRQEISEEVRRQVNRAVARTIKEYGETLKRLGKE